MGYCAAGIHTKRGGALSLAAWGVGSRPRTRTAATWVEHLVLALTAFVPQLLSKPGVVQSDTKSFLYLDPSTYLRQSASLWDPSVGLGTVTHEQIGYLFPMGPFFWAVHVLHLPVWLGQRLWIGAILFAAGSGVLFLCRTIGLNGPGRLVAGFAFMLSPYFLQYVGRISVILLPWAGLGWMVGLVIRAVRTGGWRFPALFALVWLAVSGVNASGVLYAGVAPALWFPYSVLVVREHSWRQVWTAVWRIVVLVAAVSLWWAVALAVEGHYGLKLLSYTEQIDAVTKTSLSSEILRGLGYWYFYPADNLGQLIGTSVAFTQQLQLIALTFAVPVLALASAVVVRWRHRGYFVLLTVVGMVLAVAAYPFSSPSPVGVVLKNLMTRTTVGMAMRSTDRAAPLVLLGVAVLLGAGVTAVATRRRVAGLVVGVVVCALVAAANPPVWNGTTVEPRYTRPNPLPRYVTQAAAALNAEHKGTRVLAIPGENKGAYRYGNTVDSIWPGLLTRSFVTHQQLPLGSLPGYDLVYGLDDPIQTRTTDPSALAPVARLMSVGDILVQNDLAYEHYGQPPPRQLWQSIQPTPVGLGAPVGYGAPKPNVSRLPWLDMADLAHPPTSPPPSPLEVLAVPNPRPLVRGESTSGALVLDGDGVGLTQIAGLGLLNTRVPVFYSGTLARDTRLLGSVLHRGATLVVTDSNRKRYFRWNQIQGNAGVTLGSGNHAPPSPLNIFPTAASDTMTTSQFVGVESVSASAAPPGHTPVMALDGDRTTEWESPTIGNQRRPWWQVRLTAPITTNTVTLVQPLHGVHNQWITRATLRFDDHHTMTTVLGPQSRQPQGQVVSFPTRTFRTLRIQVDATNFDRASPSAQANASPVGFSEVGVGGVRAGEIIAMPSDLMRASGATSEGERLVIAMSRVRIDPTWLQPDPEPMLARAFVLPTSRTFKVAGTARLSSLVPDQTIDTLVGRPGGPDGAPTAQSSSRLAGDVGATASSALGGTPGAMWSPDLGTRAQAGSWIRVELPRPVTFDHLRLQVATDGHHSVPTAVRITTDRGSASVPLPHIDFGTHAHAVTTVPVRFAALSGRTITVTFTDVRLKRAQLMQTRNFRSDYYTTRPVGLPLGIVDLGIPGVQVRPAPPTVPDQCRSDLLTIDGSPVWIKVSGSSGAALAGGGLAISTCGPDAGGVSLGPGRHVVLSARGSLTGLDVDQLSFDSAPGGGAGAVTTSGLLPAPSAPRAPSVTVTSMTATKVHARVRGASGPFWLVLGESVNPGWHLSVDGSGRDLHQSLLTDGYANGWLVDPTTTSFSVTLRWTPQTSVDIAIVVSVLAVAGCVLLAALPLRRRRARRPPTPTPTRTSAGAGSVASVAAKARHELPAPILVNPFARVASRPELAVALATALGCGIVSAAIVPTPAVGLAVGAAVLLALRRPTAQGLFALAVISLSASAAAYCVIHQAIGHFQPVGWPTHFDPANTLVWAAIAFLGADVVVDRVLSAHGFDAGSPNGKGRRRPLHRRRRGGDLRGVLRPRPPTPEVSSQPSIPR